MAAVLTEAIDQVFHVTLNRPDALNSIDTELADGLLAAMDALDNDPSLRIGLIAARGRCFCAGMDLKAFVKSGSPASIGQFFERGSTNPLIAAIEGAAYAGGLEIALTCDLLVASSAARCSRGGLTEPENWDLTKQSMPKVFGSSDAREGAIAFAEKRPAAWTGQ